MEHSDTAEYLYVKIYFPESIDGFKVQFVFFEFLYNQIVTPVKISKEGKENMVSLSINPEFLNDSKLSIHYGHETDDMLRILRFSLSQ